MGRNINAFCTGKLDCKLVVAVPRARSRGRERTLGERRRRERRPLRFTAVVAAQSEDETVAALKEVMYFESCSRTILIIINIGLLLGVHV